MRRLFLILWIPVLLLSGCAGKGFDPQQLRTFYSGQWVDAAAQITTHDGFFAEYELSFSEGEDGARVEVLAPDSVKGISARLSSDGLQIGFEDLQLDALSPETFGFSPIDALPGFLHDLRERTPDNFAAEGSKDAPLLTLEYSDRLSDGTETLKRLTLDAQTMALTGGELYLEGQLILSVQVKEFSLRPREAVATGGRM